MEVPAPDIAADDARRRIVSALDAADHPHAPFDILRAALDWVAETVRAADGSSSGAAAFVTLTALDDALSAAPAVAGALPWLMSAARPGDAIERQLADRTDALTALAAEVAADRATLDELAVREKELTARAAEHTELRRQVDELRRLERLVGALDVLAGQQDVIDARLKVLRALDNDADTTLRAGSEEVLRLTEQQLALVGSRTRTALDEADLAQRSLAEQEAALTRVVRELTEVTDRLTLIRDELGGSFAELRLREQADRELAQALARFSGTTPVESAERSRVEQARAVIETIGERLAEAEDTLRRIMVDRDARVTEGRRRVFRTAAG